MAASRNQSLDRFLSNNRSGRGQGHTHTRIRNESARIPGGSYLVEAKDEELMRSLYYKKVFVQKAVEHLTEKQLTDDGPMLVDIDLRYPPTIEDRQHTEEHTEDMVLSYIDTLDQILEIPSKTKLNVMIMQKPDVNKQEDKTKDGIHMIICMKTPRALNLMVRKRMIKELKTIWQGLPIANSWEDVLDEGVAKGSVNWQMYGSCKPGNQTYLITQHLTAEKTDGAWELIENDLAKFDTEKMFPYLSARYKNHPGFELRPECREEFMELSVPNRPTHSKTRPSAPARYDSISSQKELDDALQSLFEDISPIDYRLKETHEFAMSLPADYYGPGSYNKWIRVGWAMRNTSPKMFFSFLHFSAQKGCRGTLRGPDGQFDWSKVPELFDMWREFGDTRKDGLTHRSIMYWAKQSDKEKYEAVRSQTIDFFIEQTISRPDGLEFDMANVLYNIYKDRFVCSSIQKNTWYEFRRHRWEESDSGTALRRFISTEMHQLYVQKVMESTNQMNQQQQDDENWENNRKRTKKLCDIADLLKRTVWKKNIMTEAKELFFDKDFYGKLDQNAYLLCFRNGVVDFKNRVHRKGQPDDYISKCTNIDYIPIESARRNPEFAKVETFMAELFPNPSLRGYMYQHLSSCLLGTNQNQTFNIYKGIGSNGKSLIVQLMSKVLGQYKGTVPFALLTQKRSSIGSTSSEIVQLMGVRYAVMQEPSKGDKVNEGIMKEITGGDPIQGRALFKDTVTFVPQFKLVVCTNVDIEFMSNDDGTWRRIRVCDFESKFVDNPGSDPKYPSSRFPHQFKKDKSLENKLDAWAPLLASHLVEMAYERQGDVSDCAEVMSSSNRYRERQDTMSEFARDCLKAEDGAKATKNDLLTRFNDWKKSMGVLRIPVRDMMEFMTKTYGPPDWHGIRVKYENDDVEDQGDVAMGNGNPR